MEFSWSGALYLVPAILIAVFMQRRRGRSFVGHSLASFLSAVAGRVPLRIYLPGLLDAAGIICLGLALLNPIVPYKEHLVDNEGLNLVLVIDLSSSMQMPIVGGRKSPTGREETRLDAVKSAIIDFIGERANDRIGIVVFSNDAYVVTPLTTDHAYVKNYIRMIDDRTLADEGMTAIGEGLLAARDLLVREQSGSSSGNVIVLLTDGESNAGRPVEDALSQVRVSRMKTYLIGVEMLPGSPYERTGSGNAVPLASSVETTGGRYFDAQDADQLRRAYREISSLEKARYRARERKRNVPVFAPFAAAALVLLMCGIGLRNVPAFRQLS